MGCPAAVCAGTCSILGLSGCIVGCLAVITSITAAASVAAAAVGATGGAIASPA